MKKKAIIKWSSGIFSAVLTAVAIWYVTNRLIPSMKTVDVNILEFNLLDTQILKGEKTFAYFKIKNEGNTSATNCACSIRDENDSVLVETDEFSLESDEVITDSLRLPNLEAQQNKKLSLFVQCEETSHSYPQRDINIDVIKCTEKIKIDSLKYTGIAFMGNFRAKMVLSNPCDINLKETTLRCIVYRWNDLTTGVDTITTEPFKLEGHHSVNWQLAGSKKLSDGIYRYRITASDRIHKRMEGYKTGQFRIKSNKLDVNVPATLHSN